MSLEEFFLPNEEVYTHCNYNTKQKLRQKHGSEGANFLNNYCKHIYDLSKTGGDTVDIPRGSPRKVDKLYYGEHNEKEDSPIIILLTLSYATKPEETPYTDKFIEIIKAELQSVVQELISKEDGSDDTDTETYMTMVLTKPRYKRSVTWTYEIRLQMPFCRMAVSDQKRYLRNLLVKRYKKENVLDMLNMKPTGSIETILDSTVLDDCVPMYGSFVDEFSMPFKLYDIFDNNGESVSLDDIVDNVDPSLHADVEKYNINFSVTAKRPIEYWLPVILSVKYKGGQLYVPTPKDTPEEKKRLAVSNNKLTDEQEIAEKMLSLISLARIKNAAYRNKVGKALYTLYEGKAEGWKRWKQWCQQVPEENYEDDDYWKSEYETFSVKNYISEITLQQYAKEDNWEKYTEWFNDKRGELQDEAVKMGTQGSLARLYYFMNKTHLTFVNKSWYRFSGAYLEEINSDIIELSDLLKLFQAYEADLKGDQNEVKMSEARELAATKKDVRKIISLIDNASSASGITRFLRGIYARKTSKVMLNNDWYILPDAKYNVIETLDPTEDFPAKYIIRKGVLEDYQTFHSDVILPGWDWDNVWMKELDKYENQIYTPDQRVYMRMRRSKNIRGHNEEKKILHIIGPPHSSKTTDLSITAKAFGSGETGTFFTTASTAATGKRGGSSNSTPDMANTNNKKEVNIDDPERVNEINEGWFAAESGGSARYTRFNYDNGTSSEATASMSISSNDPQPFSPTEQMKVRVVIFYYRSKFLSPDDQETLGIKVPDTIEEQRKKRIFPKHNLDKYKTKLAQARLQMMVYGLENIDWRITIPITKTIKIDTSNYWTQYDYYTIFANNYLVKVKTPESGGAGSGGSGPKSLTDPHMKVHIDTVYDVFDPWFKRKYRGINQPSINIFRRCMIGVIGDTDDKGYYDGYKLRDRRFDKFIDTLDNKAGKGIYLSGQLAYQQFKNWSDRFGVRLNIYDYFSFIDHMVATIGNYDEKKGFEGYSIKEQPDVD